MIDADPSRASPSAGQRGATALAQNVWGAEFQNPILLAAGTAGYGQELDGLLDLDALGGIVTKAVTPEPRVGNPPMRAAEYDAGMLNSVGLANVGLDAFRREKLPWLRQRLRRAHVLVNVAGRTVEDYVQVVRALDDDEGFLAYELNVSCPNVREGGAIFCMSPQLLHEVVAAARAATQRPLVVKLSPNLPDIGGTAAVAVDAGADGVTLINTFPGMLFDVETRTSLLGAGTGGVSGPGVLPMGVHAVWQAHRRVDVPLVGVGGVRTGDDAVQYLLAGASLVAVGTATFADPRTAERVVLGLSDYCARHHLPVHDLVGGGTVEGRI